MAPAGSGPALCHVGLVPGSRVRLGSNGRRATVHLEDVRMQVAHDSPSRSPDRVMQSFLRNSSWTMHRADR